MKDCGGGGGARDRTVWGHLGMMVPESCSAKAISELAEEGQVGASVPGIPGNSDPKTSRGEGDKRDLGSGIDGGTLEGLKVVAGFTGI